MNTCECCGQVKPTPTLSPDQFWLYGYPARLSCGIILDVDKEKIIHHLGFSTDFSGWRNMEQMPMKLKVDIDLDPNRVLDTIADHQLHHG